MLPLTLPKYLSNSSTYLWMISRVISSLSSGSMATQKYRLAYLRVRVIDGILWTSVPYSVWYPCGPTA